MIKQATDGAIRFWVPGLAKPGGSKKGFYIEKIKRVVITDDSGKEGKQWRQDVKQAAFAAMDGRDPLTGPLLVMVRFVMPRSQGHYGTGANASRLKDSAPAWPLTRPDTTKLFRALEDACTGIVWVDDAQVVMQLLGKEYGTQIGAEVVITRMSMELSRALRDCVLAAVAAAGPIRSGLGQLGLLQEVAE